MSAWAEITAMSSSDSNHCDSLARMSSSVNDTDVARDTCQQHQVKYSRFADDDNYMLKFSDAAAASVRPRSSSLSRATLSPSSPAAAAGDADTEATSAAPLPCSCLPSCCCNCMLISSIAQCQTLVQYVTQAANRPESASPTSQDYCVGGDSNSKPIVICVDELCETASKISIDLSEKASAVACSPSCDQSHRFLGTFLHRGLVCHACGRAAYRTCSATGLPSCLPSSQQSNNGHKSVFGVGLCGLFNPCEQAAPTVLMRLVQEIEIRARQSPSLDLYRLYRTKSIAESVMELRTRLSEDPCEMELSSYDLQVIVWALKRFLRELPDPVIPVHWYERFISASKNTRDDLCAAQLYQLVQQLPDHHRSTLRFLLAHICRMCQLEFNRGVTEIPTAILQTFSQVILRPAWELIMKVVHNSVPQQRVVELLVLYCDWGESLPHFTRPPTPPPRFQPRPLADSGEVMDPNQSLYEAEWFWDNITREEANDLLRDAPDGSFLVRNATSSTGEYTLTLKKGGCNKLIKIKSHNGRYGFSEPLPFRSVTELITFYRGVSLAHYHSVLDTKLLHPVSRIQQRAEAAGDDVDKLVNKWLQLNAECVKRVQLYDQYYEDYSRSLEELQLKKQVLEALAEAAVIFEEQIGMHEKLLSQSQRPDPQAASENCELAKSRLHAIKESREMLEENIRQQAAYSRSLDRELNGLKPDLQQSIDLKEQLCTRLVRLGVARDKLARLLADDNSPSTKSNPPVADVYPLHANVSLWLLPDCNREEAEQLLRRQPDGTFLIRCSTRGNAPYALSIVYSRTVGHCLIYRSEKGYGFAEPCFFPSLKDLVLHHANATLEDYNSFLTTTLMYPVLALTHNSHSLPPC